MTPLYQIHISEDLRPPLGMDLFSILERLLPVRFICSEQGEIGVAGNILVRGLAKKEAAIRSDNTPSLSVPPLTNPVNEAQHVEVEVSFSDDPGVPFPLRGRRVNTKLGVQGLVLSLNANEKVLATSNGGPIWSVSEAGAVKHFRSALPLPHIASEQNFSDVFNGERFLEMLVLLQFVREVSASMAYQNAPLRASFIIDDPNLHWPRYGFVNYREIAAHARQENYHVSFATIPLDTWFAHSTTVDLFQRNSQWLSLLVHGNDHAKEELARNYSGTMRKALLLQAIRRIECLEQKTKMRVCRVMVPPHGACSEEMLIELPKCGFESACISAGSLRAHNQDKPWIKTLGFFPSETIKGSTVLPRWGLTGNVNNALLIAAYLGQPMILRGHHQDLKDGVEVLDEFAKFINGLGNVFWSNMTDISRLNYLWRMEGTTCYVKPLGRKIAFQLPSVATEVIIEGFSAMDDGARQVISNAGSGRRIMPGEPLFLSEEMGRKILLERAALPEPDLAKIGLKPTTPGLIARRLLTEARDRFFYY